MIDFGKLYCDIHPNQLITNFCLNQSCMLGLCATCICTHTDNHIQCKSSPEYQNIRNTYSMMHDMIRKNISQIDIQKNRIQKLNQFILTKRKTIKSNVQQLRCDTIRQINMFFQHKQKMLLRQMQTQQKRIGLHSQIRLQSLLNTLNRQSTTLLNSAQQINSLNFLQSYKRIKSQIITNTLKVQTQISTQLDQNQDFQTTINMSNDHIQKLVKVLDNSIGLTFKINQRNKINNNNNNINNVNNNNVNNNNVNKQNYQKCQSQYQLINKRKQSDQLTSRFQNNMRKSNENNTYNMFKTDNVSTINILQDTQSNHIINNHNNINNDHNINNNHHNNINNQFSTPNSNLTFNNDHQQNQLLRKQTANFRQINQTTIRKSLQNSQQNFNSFNKPLYRQLSQKTMNNNKNINNINNINNDYVIINDTSKQINKSNPIQSICESTIFKEKDNNVINNHQNTHMNNINNRANNKNYQSQLIINNNNNNINFQQNNNKLNQVKNATSTIIYQNNNSQMNIKRPLQQQYNQNNMVMMDTFNSNGFNQMNNMNKFNTINNNNNTNNTNYQSTRYPRSYLSPQFTLNHNNNSNNNTPKANQKVVTFKQQPRPLALSQPKPMHHHQYSQSTYMIPSNSFQQFYHNNKQINNKINLNQLNQNYINQNYQNNNNNNLVLSTMEGRKVRKSGLSVMKANQSMV